MDIPKYTPINQSKTFDGKWVSLIPVLFFLVHLSGDHVFNKTNTLKMVLLLIVSSILLVAKIKSKSFTQQPALLLILLSPLLATFPGLAISQGLYSYSFPYEFIGQLLCVIWCYLLVTTPNAINTPKKIAYLFIPVIIYVCIVGVIEKMGLNPLIRFFINPFESSWQLGPEIYMGPVNRIKSTFGNINYFASFLIQLTPLCVTLFYIWWYQENTNKSSTYINRIVIVGLAVLIFSCLIFTGTRAAIIALVLSFTVVLILYLFIYKRTVSPYFFLGVIGMAALSFFLLSEYDQRFIDLLSADAWHSRIMPWQTAINSIKEALLFGYGLGSSYELFFNFMDIDASIRISNGSYNHVHAEPLEILQEGGIFGLLIYMLFWGWIFLIGSRFIFKPENSSHLRLIVTAILFGLLAYHIHGLFSVAPRMIPARMTAYTLVALLLILTKQNRIQERSHDGSKWPMYLIGLCLIASLAWLAPYAKSQYLYSEALASNTPNIQMIELGKSSTDVYTLHKAALSAAELNNAEALDSITSNLNQIFPHYRKAHYLSAYGKVLSNDIDKAKQEGLQVQSVNQYQVDTGILLGAISIIQLDESELKKQFSFALKSLACKASVIDCEQTDVRTVIGNMHSPIQFMVKPEKITTFIDHAFLPYLNKKARSSFINEDSAINALTLEYAQLLSSSDFFKPDHLATSTLTVQDHQSIESHIKASNVLKNSTASQSKTYISQLRSDDSLIDQISKYFLIDEQFLTKRDQANHVIKESTLQLLDKLNMQAFLKRRSLQLLLASWLAQSTKLAASQLDKHLPSSKIPNAFKSTVPSQGNL